MDITNEGNFRPSHPTPRLGIAMVTGSFLPAQTNSDIQVQKVAAALIRRGHKVVVLTTRLPGQRFLEIWNGIRIYRLFSISLGGHNQALASASTLKRILGDNKIDVIHIHDLSFLTIRAIKVAQSLKIKTVYSPHNNENVNPRPFYLNILMAPIQRYAEHLCKQSKDIVCTSTEQAAQMKWEAPRARVHCIANPTPGGMAKGGLSQKISYPGFQG